MDHQTTKVSNYLILQLKRFDNLNGDFIKEIAKVRCTKTLSVPLAEGEVSFHKMFSLITSQPYRNS